MGGPWISAHPGPSGSFSLFPGSAAVSEKNPLVPAGTIIRVEELAGLGAGPNGDLFYIHDTGPRVGSNQIDIMNRGLLDYRKANDFEVVGRGPKDWAALTSGGVQSLGSVTDNPFADPSWTTPVNESSPGEVTDNPFADPSWTTPVNESSPGEVTDNPFADQSWTPDRVQQWIDDLRGVLNPSQNTPPTSVTLPEFPVNPQDLLSVGESGALSMSDLLGPSQYYNSLIQSLSGDANSDRPGFADLSSVVPQGSLPSSPVEFAQGIAGGSDWFNQLLSPSASPDYMFGAGSPAGSLSPVSAAQSSDQITQSIGGNDISQFGIIPSLGDLPAAPDVMSSPGEVTDNPFADPSWTTPVNESSSGEITDNPFADPAWGPQAATSAPSVSPAAVAQQLIDHNAASAGIAGRPDITWNDLMGAPHTGELFAATQTDPNTGRISTFDPITGSYQPLVGPAGWTNTGYGAYSPYGAGSAGYAGGGFGGYGGLGGTGAPVMGHVGGMVDTSTPGGLSHGGVDPFAGSDRNTGTGGESLGESGIFDPRPVYGVTSGQYSWSPNRVIHDPTFFARHPGLPNYFAGIAPFYSRGVPSLWQQAGGAPAPSQAVIGGGPKPT